MSFGPEEQKNQQAAAWRAVVALLDELRPRWNLGRQDTTQQKALDAIRGLAVPPAETDAAMLDHLEESIWDSSDYDGNISMNAVSVALSKAVEYGRKTAQPEGGDRDFLRGLHEAKIACMGEFLEDPQDQCDKAYDLAIEHCIAAIAAIERHQPQVDR